MPASGVRIDPTTESLSAEEHEQGLLHLGHRKDHRPDLPQCKLVLASLDPSGLPLATDVLSGEHADDPVDVPLIARVRDGLQQKGLLDVGDGTMAALQTRASIQAQADDDLAPLSALQAPPEQVSQEVETQRRQGAHVVSVCRVDEQGASTCMAQGDETVCTMTAQVDGATRCWQERRLVVQSMAATRSVQAHVQERVQKTQQTLHELTARRQGNARVTTREDVEEAIQAVLRQCRVEGLLQVQIQEHVHERPVRASRGRLSGVRRDLTFTLVIESVEGARTQAMSQLGWRVSATTMWNNT